MIKKIIRTQFIDNESHSFQKIKNVKIFDKVNLLFLKQLKEAVKKKNGFEYHIIFEMDVRSKIRRCIILNGLTENRKSANRLVICLIL